MQIGKVKHLQTDGSRVVFQQVHNFPELVWCCFVKADVVLRRFKARIHTVKVNQIDFWAEQFKGSVYVIPVFDVVAKVGTDGQAKFVHQIFKKIWGLPKSFHANRCPVFQGRHQQFKPLSCIVLPGLNTIL